MASEVCDVCGSTNVREIKCTLICQNCGTVLRTCADLVSVTISSEENRNGS